MKTLSPWARLRGALSVEDPTFRQAARLATAAGLAGLVAVVLDLSRTYWAVFAAVVALNAPPGLGPRRAVMRIADTVAGFVLGIALLALVGDHRALAVAIALLLLLPGLMLMPINYGAGVLFITCMVAMLYSATGEESDFLHFRVLDNLAGAGVVIAVGLLLWRSSNADWWRIAGLTARALARVLRTTERAACRSELMTRVVQIHTETVNAAALPDGAPESAGSWMFVVAVENLVGLLVGRRPVAPDPEGDPALAARLDRVADHCEAIQRGAGGRGQPPGPDTALPELELARMETAVTLLDPGIRQRDRRTPSPSRP
jgi:hypothetical protein